MKIFQEELLETVARSVRFKEGFKKMAINSNISLLDLGCGPKALFYRFLLQKNLSIKSYVGIDPLIKEDENKTCFPQNTKEVKLIRKKLVANIYLPDESVDCVVGFAFLEHINYPNKIVEESIRVLKKGGKAIFTAPTPIAKLILELLLSRIDLISRREVAEHKRYFNKNSLLKLTQNSKGNIEVEHSYFELGLNNLLVIKKN